MPKVTWEYKGAVVDTSGDGVFTIVADSYLQIKKVANDTHAGQWT